MSDRPAGLYLHVPFCASICPYCDFAVRTGNRERRQRFVDGLLAEIALHADSPRRYDTIYLGGGTPSLLDEQQLGRILESIGANLRLADDTRIFLEANPEDATREAIEGWRRLGVDTLSLGIQSLDSSRLSFLGRSHGPEEARRSVALASDAGFHTVAIDLIYGTPGQTAFDWEAELERALGLEAQHISCYQLTIHSGTRFGLLEHRGELMQLPTDGQADLFMLTHRRLNGAGLQGYEVSQFAVRPEHQSRHNVKYWNHSPYLGLGPSAHSFDGRRRWWNVRRTDAWEEIVGRGERPIEQTELLDAAALTLEALMTGLRTYAGVDLDQVHSLAGVDLRPANLALIERLQSEGLARLEGNRLQPTLEGLAVADAVASSFRIEPPSQSNSNQKD